MIPAALALWIVAVGGFVVAFQWALIAHLLRRLRETRRHVEDLQAAVDAWQAHTAMLEVEGTINARTRLGGHARDLVRRIEQAQRQGVLDGLR